MLLVWSKPLAKGLLSYHGIGSGIKRALADWPDITFADDHDGCLFTATVRRKADRALADSSPQTPQKTSGKTSGKILVAICDDHSKTIPELSSLIGVTERSIERNIRE